jgi:hypothetical protein
MKKSQRSILAENSGDQMNQYVLLISKRAVQRFIGTKFEGSCVPFKLSLVHSNKSSSVDCIALLQNSYSQPSQVIITECYVMMCNSTPLIYLEPA